ncbi:hypothetical protein B296_00053541 [Ensete ventricosum]|uniref:Uncharacterized protein n=1 Tax=Ensete ventricosum TaxID=4639 RepID=A0A426Y7L9_ENSVE|nr:hypothetical protein B296_00053541 [Ensete ventricosum]
MSWGEYYSVPYNKSGQTSWDAKGADKKLGLMARAAVSLPEVEEVPTEVALRSATTPTPKRPTEGSMAPPKGSSHVHKRVKVSVGKHKSRSGEGGSRAHSKGKESAASGEEPMQPAYRCPKLYLMPSEVLLAQAVKQIVWVSNSLLGLNSTSRLDIVRR